MIDPTAALPSTASPQTIQSALVSTIARSPDRTTSWSSAIRIRFTVPVLSIGTTAAMRTTDEQ
jgi:hypothetical protein